MLDWCLQSVPQIQQGFQIKSPGMIFITRPTYLEVLMGKEYLYFSNKNTFLVRLLFLSLTGLPCMLMFYL